MRSSFERKRSGVSKDSTTAISVALQYWYWLAPAMVHLNDTGVDQWYCLTYWLAPSSMCIPAVATLW